MDQLALKQKPLRQVANVRELLMNDFAKKQLADIAARHITPDRMMKLVANALRTTPKLGDCEPMSLLGALMTCASIGLEPNTVLGHAFLVPFRNNRKGVTEVQVILGYKGLIDLARRSGHITSISAMVHYSDDELWDYEEGTEARLRHRPGPQEGDKLHAYAVAKFTDGGFAFAVMPWSAVMKIRDGSQNWRTAVKFGKEKQSPWHTHEDAMAAKTAIRALSKYLPMSIEMQNAMDVDEGQRDFAALALGSETTIEGTATEAEGGDVVEDDPGEDPQVDDRHQAASSDDPPPADEKKAAPKKSKEPYGVPTEVATVIDRILEDLQEAKTGGDVEGIVGMFEMELAQIREIAPAAGEALDAEIDAARERVSGGAA